MYNFQGGPVFFWILCKKIRPLFNLLFIANRKFLSKLGQHISWNGILHMGKVHHVGRPIIRYIHVKYWFRVGFFRSYHHSCTVALPFKTFAWFIDASCWPRQPFFFGATIYIRYIYLHALPYDWYFFPFCLCLLSIKLQIKLFPNTNCRYPRTGVPPLAESRQEP